MSNEIFEDFLHESIRGINNKDQRIISESISEQYANVLEKSNTFFRNPKLIRQRAVFAKYKIFDEFEHYLIEFDQNFTKKGGKIIWAQDTDEALKAIVDILKRNRVEAVVKSTTSIAEEIGLNKFLEEEKIAVLETEINSFIQQLKKVENLSKDYPIMEISADIAAKVIQQKMGLSEGSTTLIFDFLKKHFINRCNQTTVGITGANFLISDTGSVVVCEDQGNISLCTAFPDIHIILAGIDKLIPSITDLEAFVNLLAANSSGKNMMYNTQIINGPAKETEKDGPKEVYLVLLNNGRTDILKNKKQRRILHCIHCGACHAACPVLKLIGEKPYNGVYTGPIASVAAPYIDGFYKSSHLSYACTLCGKCTEVCPMNIPLHQLILHDRNNIVQDEFYVTLDRSKMKGLKKMMLKRKVMESAKANLLIRFNYKKAYGNARIFPDLSQKSYNEIWREKPPDFDKDDD